ncbi:MAG TPA: GNAT family N-acetyltransferase [Ruminiclostridium sp.]|nr:GNAT family N-acetyltransferase [Ruminiclostridium sp.]
MGLYKIVKLEPKDYYKCLNIWNMEKDPDRTKKWYDELVNGNRITFVYTENNEFIGEGSLVFMNDDPDYTIPNKRIYLSRLIVKAGYRNCGIGGIIVDYLIDYAKRLGYEEISVGVDLNNSIARHLYEKKGFINVIFEGEDEYGKYVKLVKKL